MPERRVAILTGASGGLGPALTRALLTAGWAVLAVARKQPGLDALLPLGEHGDLRLFRADVAAGPDATGMAKAAAGWGAVDLLVNAAGWAPWRRAEDTPEWLLDKCYTANFRSCFLASVAVAQVMPRGGSIINFTSTVSVKPSVGRAAYGAAKAAVRQLTRTLALEWGPQGIAVNSISPGVVLTEEVRALLQEGGEAAQMLESATATGSYCEPDDVASLVVGLASQSRSALTGQEWVIDAGWTLV